MGEFLKRFAQSNRTQYITYVAANFFVSDSNEIIKADQEDLIKNFLTSEDELHNFLDQIDLDHINKEKLFNFLNLFDDLKFEQIMNFFLLKQEPKEILTYHASISHNPVFYKVMDYIIKKWRAKEIRAFSFTYDSLVDASTPDKLNLTLRNMNCYLNKFRLLKKSAVKIALAIRSIKYQNQESDISKILWGRLTRNLAHEIKKYNLKLPIYPFLAKSLSNDPNRNSLFSCLVNFQNISQEYWELSLPDLTYEFDLELNFNDLNALYKIIPVKDNQEEYEIFLESYIKKINECVNNDPTEWIKINKLINHHLEKLNELKLSVGENLMRVLSPESESELKFCTICLKNPREWMFPCGHVVACRECAEQISDKCPVCRKAFPIHESGTVAKGRRIYLS